MMTRIIFLFCIFLKLFLQAQEEFSPNATVMIPMRDGYLIPADVYLPNDWNGEKLPCLLLRCPAGRKALPWVGYSSLAHFGYVVVMQDTRNALDQQGKTAPFLSDGWGTLQDGYDSIEWLAKSQYSNGKIGTLGFSAVGCTQLLLAPSAPPSLKCQYIGVGAGSIYHHAIFPGGQLLKNQVEGWLGAYSKDTGVLSYVTGQPFYNRFWEELDSIKVANRVKVPGFLYGGWYDTFLQGTIDAFTSRHYDGGEGAIGKQKLLIGPWTHWWPMSSKLGDFTVPETGFNPSFDMSPQRWFDYHLKGIDNNVQDLPTVTYYVMGPFDGSSSSGNCWKTSDKWPVSSENKTFYLTKNQKLVADEINQRRYTYKLLSDPKKPVQTIGGRNLFLESGPMDQRPVEERSDVIVFTSDVLKDDLEITGKAIAKLFVTSDVLDADFAVRVTDVYPDGKSILILDGLHRTAIQSPQIKKWNVPQEIEIDLASTSMVFAKGHRIRVSISGSNYPRYEVNHHVGNLQLNSGLSKVAKNKIFTGNNYPSRLILPKVKSETAYSRLKFK